MSFGTTPLSTTSLGANQFPVSAVAVPGHSGGNLTALEGGPANTDSNGNETAPASMYIKDGADVTQGTSTDTAGANTVIGQLKQIRVNTSSSLPAGTNLIGSVELVDSAGTNKASISASGAIKVDNSGVTQPVNGTITANAGTNLNTSLLALESGGNLAAAKADLDTIVSQTAAPNVSDRWARQVGQVDVARVLGAALSNTNPVLVEQNIQNWIRNGQSFVVTTGLVTGASATCGISIWNGSSGKNALIYSVRFLDQQGGQAQVGQIYKVTSNPALANSATPVNKNFGSVTTSLMTCTSAISGVSITGTLLESFPTNSPAVVELIQPGNSYFLPSNANTGLAISVAMSGTGGFVQLSVHYVEF